MDIELIYATDCPHVEPARAALREALEQMDLPIGWKEWDRAAVGTPAHARRFGSPTILVNGSDVTGTRDTAGADCCRVYRDRHGFSGAPSAETIMGALKAVRA